MCRTIGMCFRMIISVKFCLFNLIWLSTVLLVIWVIIINRQVLPPWTSRKTHTQNEDTKYLLLWSNSDYAPFSFFMVKDVFVKNNCSYVNCIATDDRSYFGGDLTKFHAIAFNGRFKYEKVLNIPRDNKQKYIYVNTESSRTADLINYKFDGFINWTATYRLRSDIPYPYILIRDISGNIVGPRINIKWRQNMTEVDDELADQLRKKKKLSAAIAFISHCNAKSKRDQYMRRLKKSLFVYGFILDIYGDCGNRVCPRSEQAKCDKLVEKYYFYLAFENSFAEDYVTEKVLRALNNNAVPIVYGGADYSRFLPPNSYLNARMFRPDQLAALIVYFIKKPDEYRKFFRWKKHYTFHSPMTSENVCSFCAALNNNTMYETPSVYKDMYTWWNCC